MGVTVTEVQSGYESAQVWDIPPGTILTLNFQGANHVYLLLVKIDRPFELVIPDDKVRRSEGRLEDLITNPEPGKQHGEAAFEIIRMGGVSLKEPISIALSVSRDLFQEESLPEPDQS